MSLLDKAKRFKQKIDANSYLNQQKLDVENLEPNELKKIVYIYDEFEIDKPYSVGDYVEHHEELYKCLKAHKGDYQLLPNLDTEHWKAVKGKAKQREFYSRDKTYKKGDEVEYYRKPYVYINDKATAGKDPEKDSDYWRAI